eukprot:885489-Rhodomonas_salina.2
MPGTDVASRAVNRAVLCRYQGNECVRSGGINSVSELRDGRCGGEMRDVRYCDGVAAWVRGVEEEGGGGMTLRPLVLRDVRYKDSIWCSVMCGTDARLRDAMCGTDMRGPVLTSAMPLRVRYALSGTSAFALPLALRCAVLTQASPRPGRVKELLFVGNSVGEEVTPPLLRRCPVLTWRMLLCACTAVAYAAMSRRCYALSGTDIRWGATRD